MASTCWTCRFFVEDAENPDFGECHRYPRVGLVDEEGPFWAYPTMECLDWCGEFKEETPNEPKKKKGVFGIVSHSGG